MPRVVETFEALGVFGVVGASAWLAVFGALKLIDALQLLGVLPESLGVVWMH
jgi:hypothetical protein